MEERVFVLSRNHRPVPGCNLAYGRSLSMAVGFGLCLTLAGCFGGVPSHPVRLESRQNLGHDWQAHYRHGLNLLSEDALFSHTSVFTRAAFSSASRFARDHAPSYVGLGLAEMNLGNVAEAQIAFLNAALIDDRSMYWALSAIAALRNGDERVAHALFQAMQRAKQPEDDPASRFIRAVYLEQDITYDLPLKPIPGQASKDAAEEDLVCDGDAKDAICRNLNIVANIHFVRRYTTDSLARGTDFFNDLTLQLGAESTRHWNRENGERQTSILNEVSLSIPEIQYAVRLTPNNNNSNVYVSAAPSIITSIGQESEIHEGTNMTILYNSTGDANEYTAETGLTLLLAPEQATAEYVSLKLNFEYSTISSLEPSLNAQVLGVAKNGYSITGFFPYGKPIVLGTISTGSQGHNAHGQSGLRRIPLVGGAFGRSEDQHSTSDTLVLGVLSEPAAFKGSREQRILDAMGAMGVLIEEAERIERRKIIHLAPDMSHFGVDYLKALGQLATD